MCTTLGPTLWATSRNAAEVSLRLANCVWAISALARSWPRVMACCTDSTSRLHEELHGQHQHDDAGDPAQHRVLSGALGSGMFGHAGLDKVIARIIDPPADRE